MGLPVVNSSSTTSGCKSCSCGTDPAVQERLQALETELAGRVSLAAEGCSKARHTGPLADLFFEQEAALDALPGNDWGCGRACLDRRKNPAAFIAVQMFALARGLTVRAMLRSRRRDW